MIFIAAGSVMTKLQWSKNGPNSDCNGFSAFLSIYPTFDFFSLTTDFKFKDNNYYNCTSQIIFNLTGALQAQIFSSSPELRVPVLVFLTGRSLSLSAIISIMEYDD